MTHQNEIEERLAVLGQDWGGDDTFVEKVMERVAPTPSPAGPRRSVARRAVRTFAGTAAALMLGVVGWHFMGPSPGQSMLYAQVLAATKKVDSLHAVSEVTNADGTVTKSEETWFARGRGFAVILGEYARIDDGRFYWEHSKGAKFASRTKSRGTDELLDKGLDFKAEMDRFCERLPAGDRTIDGRLCQCYQHRIPEGMRAADPQGQAARETKIYISDDFLVRRVESRQKGGADSKVTVVRRWEYDVSVPADVFRPNFGADVAIVDADEAFDRMVDLKTAVYVEERAGLIFAIHRAERFENGGLLLMSSVRGTEETLKQFPLERRMMQPGLYLTDPPATNWRASPQGSGHFRITLASMNHQGIDAQWWILVPRGRAADEFEAGVGEVKVPVGITPMGGKYAARHKDKNGVIHHLSWDAKFPVRARPSQDPLPSLAKMAESVYADVAILPVAFKHFDLGIHDVKGMATSKFVDVATTSPAAFGAAVVEHVRYWERMDIDGQIKQGGELTFDSTTRQQGLIPGAFLSYYHIVDDETLKRLAVERPDAQKLWLRQTQVTDAGLAQLKLLPKLEQLDLAETRVTDTGLAHLQGLKSLKRLDVSATQVTEAGIREIQSALPDLKIVSETTNR